MALNFPDSPSTNEYFTDNTSGFTYQWNGVVWISVASTQTTSLKEFDDIAGSFNSSTTTFSLTFGAGSTKVYPLSVNQITIAIGGILQNAGDDYTVSGDQITFTTPPDAGLTFQGMFYGSSVSMNSAAAGSIGTSAFSTGGPIWNVGGDVTVAGIVTVGSSSVVIDGPSNEIRVGTGATVNASGIVIGGAGIVTASYFYGDGSGLSGIVSGIGTTGSVNTSGIITASSFSGSGLNITNIGGQFNAITYSPGIGATGVAEASNIVITFNKPVKANTGTITLKEGAADGTTVESFDVETSDKITISGGQITIDPTSDFGVGTSFYVAVPAGAYKDILNTSSSPGISTYSFETAAAPPPAESPGDLFGWGRNDGGHLGLNDRSDRSSPKQIPGTQWFKVAGGNGVTLLLTDDGKLYGTGSGSKIGQHDTIKRSSPTQIPGTDWDDVCSGNYCQIATKTDGTLWAWSSNGDGQLGLNDRVPRSSPHQIPGTQWDKIDTVRYGVVATKTDGTLWTWGWNRGGYNTLGHRSSPTQIPGTQWSDVHAIYDTWFATKTDGTMFGCGENTQGQMGINDEIDRSSPVQLPGTQWSNVSNVWSGRAVLGNKTDGTLWTWGAANDGTNGLNNVVPRSSPVQIPGTSWGQAESNYDSSFATKTDGTLWIWGYANYGLSVPDGGTTNFPVNGYRSSPVQIPGTDWSRTGIKNVFQSAFAFKTS